MQTLRVYEKSDEDGTLHLRVPVGQSNAEFEAVIILQAKGVSAAPSTSPAELGWPAGYFDRTFGSIDDETFERAPQGQLPAPVDLD